MLTWAGLLVWGAVGPIVLAESWPISDLAASMRVLAWMLFGVAFVGCMLQPLGSSAPRTVWVVAQSVAAVVLFWFTPDSADIELALLVVVAGQLPTILEPAPALAWLVGQGAIVIMATVRTLPLIDAVVLHTSFFAFQLFALGATSLAVSERRAKTSLARANAELQALHAMLEHESRQAERLSIARELHDSLGHGLTAMALELEAARHRAGAEVLPHLTTAQQLSKSLLADVRDVVSSMRETSTVDLSSALRALADGSHHPAVELHVPPSLTVENTAVAHAMVRAVQEAVTNTRRHANASTLRVTIGAVGNALQLEMRDDGTGAAEPRNGLGLQGMRERFEQLGGSFAVRTAPGDGFTITVSVPTGGLPRD